MLLSHLIVIALVQGLTEFLPISSSGHLALISVVTGWPDQGLVIDVMVHVGTLGAVVVYFRRDVGQLAAGTVGVVRGRRGFDAKLAVMVALATVPAVIAGGVILRYAVDLFRAEDWQDATTAVIAWATIGFGLLLWLADRLPARRRLEDLGYRDALIIGLFQALALIPGTSRSGITMTAGRFLAMGRTEAARFSLLLSIPLIGVAGLLAGLDLIRAGDVRLGLDAVVALVLSFLAALAAIKLMMAWLERAGFGIFVAYRVLLGGILLAILYL